MPRANNSGGYGMSRVRSALPVSRSSRAASASDSGRLEETSGASLKWGVGVEMMRGGERFRQRARRRTQRVEFELAVHVAVNERGNINCGADTAVVGAKDSLVGLGEGEGFERRASARRGEADDHRGAAKAEHLDRLLSGQCA